MKIDITARRPRNPLVVPARFRRAGQHARGDRTQRQQAGRALRRELEQMKHSP